MNAKRFIDLTFASVGLIAVAPLFLAIGLWVILDSPGPVFFRQKRVGRFGVPFEIYKFRSMTTDVGSPGLQITVSGDPRITRSGRFLRRHKLDELPQLINVIKGDMSLVGPRPEVAKYIRYYPERSRAMILSVRPGITDASSLEYFDESELLAKSSDPEKTYINHVLPDKIRKYEQYVIEQSVSADIRLLCRTVVRVFRAQR